MRDINSSKDYSDHLVLSRVNFQATVTTSFAKVAPTNIICRKYSNPQRNPTTIQTFWIYAICSEKPFGKWDFHQ